MATRKDAVAPYLLPRTTPRPLDLPVSSVPARPPATDFGSGAPKPEKRQGTPSPSHDENMAHAAEMIAIHKAGLHSQREKKK